MANEDEQIKKMVKGILTAIIAVFVLVIVFNSFYTIRSGQEGVLLTFNKADPVAKGDGLHMKVPIVQKIVKFDVQTQKYEAHAAAASKDLQDVSTNVAVNYHLSKGTTPMLFTEIGAAYEERVIQPAVQEVVKAVTAKFTAEELITRREEVKNGIFVLLKERMASRNINVEELAITNFAFSQSFTQAIEAKVTAEQEALTQRNKLEQVKYEAQQLVATAEGQKEAAIAVATGEAEKVKLVQQQLMQSPQYIEYIKAQRWNGALPAFYMAGSSGSNLLFNVPMVSANVTQ